MKRRSDASTLLIVIIVSILSATCQISPEAPKKYPVNESYPLNEQTRECFFKGENRYFSASKDDCFYVYGKMTGDNYELPMFYQILNFTGCIVMANLDKLKKIPLSSIMSLKGNTDFCEYKYSLVVYGNSNLERIDFSKSMVIKQEEVFIRANEKLRRDQVFNAPFAVDVGSPYDCTMEMAMKRNDCTALVGDLAYKGEEGEKKHVWKQIGKVYGTITIDDISDSDLDTLIKLTVDGWQPRIVRIVNNYRLRNMAAILKMIVTGPKPHFWFHNNTSICRIVDVRKNVEGNVESQMSWNESCLVRCRGGTVSEIYLSRLDSLCNTIDGNLILRNLHALPPNIGMLAQIVKIRGHLYVGTNYGVPDLSFLPNLEEIEATDIEYNVAIVVDKNVNFKVEGLYALKRIRGNVLIYTTKESDVPHETRKRLKEITQGQVLVSNDECKGGEVNEQYLAKLSDFCYVVVGDLILRGLEEIPKGFEKLKKIVIIRGSLIVERNTAIKDLSFLKRLEYISNSRAEQPSVKVAANENFKIKGLKSIQRIHGDVYVSTRKETDVPSIWKEILKSATDGKTTFLVEGETTAQPEEGKQDETIGELSRDSTTSVAHETEPHRNIEESKHSSNFRQQHNSVYSRKQFISWICTIARKAALVNRISKNRRRSIAH
uniref:Recep_L_domain domain-containing protein n=1 Tax=Haemonchus contortus TaxID=6289 RepID=A0A7I4YKI9_HAECO|nr:EGF receptor domain containing protein [Haemonchus contortus]